MAHISQSADQIVQKKNYWWGVDFHHHAKNKLLQEKAEAVVQYFFKKLLFLHTVEQSYRCYLDRWLQDGSVASKRDSLFITHMPNRAQMPSTHDARAEESNSDNTIREKPLQYVSLAQQRRVVSSGQDKLTNMDALV